VAQGNRSRKAGLRPDRRNAARKERQLFDRPKNAIFYCSYRNDQPVNQSTSGMTIDLKLWERPIALHDGQAVLVRPIRPEDELLYAKFFEVESNEDVRLRFFSPVKSRDLAFFSRFTHLDYARAMAFIALDEKSGEMLGVARLHDDTNDDGAAEYAVIVRSDVKNHGLGRALMKMTVEYAKAKKLRAIKGQVLRENKAMLRMCRELGFKITSDPDAAYVCNVTLKLD
jgi:acetyltransferase